MQQCYFCRRSVPEIEKITNEHVYGLWTEKILPPQPPRHEMRAWVRNPATGERVDKSYMAPVPLIHSQVGGYCNECNHGWMEGLEMAVQPFARRLFYGMDLPISVELAATIATWITKSAMVRDSQDDQRARAVTQFDRTWLYEHREPPPRTWVWVLRLEPDHGTVTARHLTSTRSAGAVTPEALLRTFTSGPNAYTTTFSFNLLTLIVASGSKDAGPLNDLAMAFPESVLRLWPTPIPCDWPPRRTTTDAQVVDFSSGVEIFPGGGI